MYKLLTRVIAIAVKLLSREARKHRRQANHLSDKFDNHLSAEQRAIANMKKAGEIYRASLDVDIDVHERHADQASALASKIKTILE